MNKFIVILLISLTQLANAAERPGGSTGERCLVEIPQPRLTVSDEAERPGSTDAQRDTAQQLFKRSDIQQIEDSAICQVFVPSRSIPGPATDLSAYYLDEKMREETAKGKSLIEKLKSYEGVFVLPADVAEYLSRKP